MANLGFVGLGAIGGQIVGRLLDKGHAVTGYNRTRARAQWLVDRGMRWADSPRGVVEAADVTFAMVRDTPALEAIAGGADGVVAGLRAGKLFIDMSTVSPAVSRSLAAQVQATGADMLDAPVSGSVMTLHQGKLSIMVGGRRKTFERAKPLLEDIGPTVTYVGGNGLAVSMKIATNLSIAVQMLALSESVLLAERSGIDREIALAVLMRSAMASPMVQYRGPYILRMPEESWLRFSVDMMQKDLTLALEEGRQLNVPLPTTGLTNEFLTAARGMGLADKDFAVLFDVLAHMAGVSR